ncbi:RelA/SpoT domain-containing protein [Bacillus cereus]|nr:RelA/SpoT domain-containing protein [Bacillus cereus]
MNEQLRTFIEDSKRYLAEKEDEFKKYQGQITSELEKILKKNSEIKDYMLNGRVKKPDSLKEKVIRKIKFYEDSEGHANIFIDKLLDDVIGIRILCLLNEDEKKIHDSLQGYFKDPLMINDQEHLVNDSQSLSFPYLAYFFEEQPVPQKNGKGIYKLKLKYIPEEGKFINIELQIKSLTHMFWGELDHMLFYKNYKYNLENELYAKMMFSVNGMLENLDTQLKDLKTHMSQSDKIKDTQNMLTKILYNSLHDDIKNIHDVELDLREVYTLLSQLFFVRCAEYPDYLVTSQKILLGLQQVEFSLPEFQFNNLEALNILETELTSYIKQSGKIDLFDPQASKILKDLSTELDTLSRGNDIFWCCLLAIHFKLSEKNREESNLLNNYKLSLIEITAGFIEGYMNKYIDDIDLDTEEHLETLTFINNSILHSLVDCFSNHKKMDFFIEDVHKKHITQIVRDFIEFYQESFEDLCTITSTSERDQIQQAITYILKIQMQYHLNKKIDKSDIRELKSIVDNLESVDWDSKINTQKLEEILNDNIIIVSLEDLQKQIYFLQEEAE